MPPFVIRPLSIETFPAFAAVVEGGRGAWGGCWCLGFHDATKYASVADAKSAKEERVRRGSTHAALVFECERVVGWCQYGPTAELPRIKHRREYDAGPATSPDWRITCFFVDRDYRHRGVAAAALAGALDLIAQAGGGLVESYPEDTSGRSVSSSFLYNSTLGLFESQGFSKVRPLGKNHWVVARQVEAGPTPR